MRAPAPRPPSTSCSGIESAETSWTDLLFSFKGRINRKPWWIAAIVAGLVAGLLTGLLDFAAKATGTVALDPDTDRLRPTGLFGAAISAIAIANMWIDFALGAKRLHDRNHSGWWMLAQLFAVVLVAIAVVIALVVSADQAPMWWAVAIAIGIVAFVVSVWLFVQIGVLRGTQGPNRFGPDPLGQQQPEPTL